MAITNSQNSLTFRLPNAYNPEVFQHLPKREQHDISYILHSGRPFRALNSKLKYDSFIHLKDEYLKNVITPNKKKYYFDLLEQAGLIEINDSYKSFDGKFSGKSISIRWSKALRDSGERKVTINNKKLKKKIISAVPKNKLNLDSHYTAGRLLNEIKENYKTLQRKVEKIIKAPEVAAESIGLNLNKFVDIIRNKYLSHPEIKAQYQKQNKSRLEADKEMKLAYEFIDDLQFLQEEDLFIEEPFNKRKKQCADSDLIVRSLGIYYQKQAIEEATLRNLRERLQLKYDEVIKDIDDKYTKLLKLESDFKRKTEIEVKMEYLLRTVDDIKDGKFYVKVSCKTGRLFSNITNIPDELFPFILIDGEEICEVDTVNCHSGLMNAFDELTDLRSKEIKEERKQSYDEHFNEDKQYFSVIEGKRRNKVIWNIKQTKKQSYDEHLVRNIKEVKKFYDATVITGQFYDEQIKDIKRIYGINIDRNKFKKEFMRDIMYSKSKLRYKSIVKDNFRQKYPFIYSVINKYKKNNYRNFAVSLQRMESKLIVYTVYPRLLEQGIICFTRHDSIVCKKSDAEKVKNEIENSYKELFGFIGQVKIK